MPPAVLAAAAGDRDQGELFARGHAVLGQQLTQLLGPDAALAGLDPADLGAVAFEDAGRVLERVADVLPVPAQRTSDQTAPHGGISGHGSCLPAVLPAASTCYVASHAERSILSSPKVATTRRAGCLAARPPGLTPADSAGSVVKLRIHPARTR